MKREKCNAGHPWTPKNTFTNKQGYVRCRLCQRLACATYRERHPEKTKESDRRNKLRAKLKMCGVPLAEIDAICHV